MKNTKDDAAKATLIAHGFGIEAEDITYMEDWTLAEMATVIEEIKSVFENFS